jgi:large subunit ribosomal protein L17
MLTRKFGRKKAHRNHMLRNLAASVILHEQVETTEAKAKEIKKLVDTSITTAKKQTLAARRQLEALYFDSAVAEKLYETLAKRFAARNGGYTQSFRTGTRHGDGVSKMIISLIAEEKKEEVKAPAKSKKAIKTETASEAEVTEAVEAPEATDAK